MNPSVLAPGLRKERAGSGPLLGLFMLALGLTLAYGKALPLACLGWLMLGWLFFKFSEFGACAVLFYGAFFHRTGFFPDLFFSLKHFHLAVALAAGADLFRQKFFTTLRQGLSRSRLLWPVWAMVVLSLIGAFTSGDPAWKTFSMTANFSCILAGLVYLSGLDWTRPMLRHAVLAFILGVVVQDMANFYNLKNHAFVFELDLMFNNQFATLNAMALVYALALTLSAEPASVRRLALTASLVIFAALALSCSRTAWFSAAVTTPFFLFRAARIRDAGKPLIRFSRLLVPAFLFAAAGVLAFLFIENVRQRVLVLYTLFDVNYLNFMFNDQQNFGSLGILRLEHGKTLLGLLSEHPWFGIGFAGKVTDFHSFYMTLLGASGIPGFILFLFFTLDLMRRLFRRFFTWPQTIETRVLTAATCAALLVWLFSSVMQTMFVHFSTWMLVLISLVLLSKTDDRVSVL